MHQTTIVSAVVFGSLLDKPAPFPSGGDDAGPVGDGGVVPGNGAPDTSNEDSGCGCGVAGKSGGYPLLAALIVLALRRRR